MKKQESFLKATYQNLSILGKGLVICLGFSLFIIFLYVCILAYPHENKFEFIKGMMTSIFYIG